MPAALALLAGCSETPAPRVEIAAHYVPACAPAAEAAPSRLALSALGDFEASNASVAILRGDAAGQTLELPEHTLAAELSALDGEPYWGSGTRDAYNRIPILLWPVRRACALVQIETASTDAEAWLAAGSDRLAALLVLGAGGESYRESANYQPGEINLALLVYPYASNLDEFDPLLHQPGINVVPVRDFEKLDRFQAIILPGSKNTAESLRYLQATGLAGEIEKAAARGTQILGICGGLQLLGHFIADPQGLESGDIAGLGLLKVGRHHRRTVSKRSGAN